MGSTTLLVFHISAATIGLLSGAMSMIFRKGSSWHAAAGNVFFVSMLGMSASAVYVAAFLRPVMINVVAGLLTFYLVSTGWRTARNRIGKTTAFDLGALLFILAVGVLGLVSGFQAAASRTGTKDRIPAGMYFAFGIIALLFASADVRMLRRGGVTGARRIARHLWPMSVALLIATMSFYPGQAKLFTRAVRDTNLLVIPHVLLIGSMFYWRYRIRQRVKREEATVAVQGEMVVGAAAGA
jgi:uncharacterized membrane protein